MRPKLDIREPIAPKTVIMVGFNDAQILDIVGPLQILSAINDVRRLRHNIGPAYNILLVAEERTALQTTSGLTLGVHKTFADIGPDELDHLDALMICGGEGTVQAAKDPALLAFMRRTAPHAHRLVSICTGTFVLASAGLIKGKKVATHWDSCAALAKRHPDLDVDEDSIFVRDGNVWTSAGVTAGMDLALALVEEDWGHDVAVDLARRHVLFMIRPGGQSQFSTQLDAQAHEVGRLGELLAWIAENPFEALTVPTLADRAHMSARTFARVFRAETGTTPAEFVERARTQAARRALEETGSSIDGIAFRCGFGNAERMRRTFHRRLNVGPKAYRARFRRSSNSTEEMKHEHWHRDF